MQTRMLWTVAALSGYAVVVLVSREWTEFRGALPSFAPWVYSGGYLVFGVLLLGAVARWWRAGSPALWRPFMLSFGALAATLDVLMRPTTDFLVPPLDRWMLALLGLVVVALLVRLVPKGLIRRWLAVDRRASPS